LTALDTGEYCPTCQQGTAEQGEIMARTVIECSCSICAIDAVSLGTSLPLCAEVNPQMLAAAQGRRKALGAVARHALVHLANDPVLSNSIQVKRFGPWVA